MLGKIDLWLLDKVFQPATDFIHNLTGKTCFRQAIYLWYVYLLTYMGHVATGTINWFQILIVFILIPSALMNIEGLKADENKHETFLNIRRISEQFLRLTFVPLLIVIAVGVCLFPISITDTLYLIWSAVAVITVYTEACNPRPRHSFKSFFRNPLLSGT